MTKAAVETKVVEELRVMAAADTNSTSKELLTPEFISMVGTVVVNLATAATLLGWIDAASAQELTRATTTILTAVGTISVNGLVVWRYLASRSQVKVAQINAQYKYAEAVYAVEHLNASRQGAKR